MINEDEWSGFLFFQIEGDLFEDPANVVIHPKDIYLQDIGTKAHTQFTNMGEEIVEMYTKHPEWMKCRMGLIHSHNSMPTFFSGEDMGELKDNCPGIDFYFSLIVNNKGEFCAKAAYMESHKVEAVKTVTFKNSKQEIVEKKEDNNYTQQIMRTVDFDVVIEDNTSELIERVIVLKKKGFIDGRPGKGSYYSEFGSFQANGRKMDSAWNKMDDEKELADYVNNKRKGNGPFQRPSWMDRTVDKDRQMSIPGITMSPMDMDIGKLCAKIVMVDEDFAGNLTMAIEDYSHVKSREDIDEYVEAVITNMPFIHMRLFGSTISSSVNFNILSYISTMKETNKFSKALIAACKKELTRKYKSKATL